MAQVLLISRVVYGGIKNKFLLIKLRARYRLEFYIFIAGNMRKLSQILVLICCLLVYTGYGQQTTTAQTMIPDSARKIALTSLKGFSTVFPITKSPLSVIVFLSPECPLCRNYSKTLNELSTEFAGKAQFIGIVPGKAYTSAEISRFIKEYSLKMNILIDPSKKFSRSLKASVTPEVIVTDNKGTIYYRGAIDDWMVALGKKKEKPSIFYLQNALSQLVNKQPVILSSTKPVGCFINDY